MNHPDWPAFLAAIVAEPDDDAVRLVAADFLEEHGDPTRAAFIRLQIAIARLEASELGHTRECGALREQEAALLGPYGAPRLWAAGDCPEFFHGTRTQAGVLALRAEGGDRLAWRRGFVERVTCPAPEWLQHGPAIRTRNPVLRAVLSGCERLDHGAWLAGLGALRGLRQVDLLYTATGMRVTVAQGTELAVWLRERLPGTRVNMKIFPF